MMGIHHMQNQVHDWIICNIKCMMGKKLNTNPNNRWHGDVPHQKITSSKQQQQAQDDVPYLLFL
jgi:hypothetical protein